MLVLGHFGMAFEGSGSKEIMTYQGSEYEITLNGRGSGENINQIIIAQDGTRSDVQFNEGGTALLIDNPVAVGYCRSPLTGLTSPPGSKKSLFISISCISLSP